jgi:hypothetical protein
MSHLLPPLPEPYGIGQYPYPDTFTEAQMLELRAATVECCIATLNASTYNMTKQECIDTIRNLLTKESDK